MNVCVAHLQINACVAKNFGAWTEKVGDPCPTFMAHPTRVGRRVGALHKKLGHPWVSLWLKSIIYRSGLYGKDADNCCASCQISPEKYSICLTLLHFIDILYVEG